jgi:hypothetical protein
MVEEGEQVRAVLAVSLSQTLTIEMGEVVPGLRTGC